MPFPSESAQDGLDILGATVLRRRDVSCLWKVGTGLFGATV